MPFINFLRNKEYFLSAKYLFENFKTFPPVYIHYKNFRKKFLPILVCVNTICYIINKSNYEEKITY